MNTTRRITCRRPRTVIAVTMGDAAGVGPELCLHLLNRKDLPGDAVPLIIGSPALLKRVARELQTPFDAPCFDRLPDATPSISPPFEGGEIDRPAVFQPPDCGLTASEIHPGKNQTACGRAAACFIEHAVRGCLARRFAAIVTAPISKKALHLAGVGFPGHTEMLAHLTKTVSYAMLFHSPQMACAFVTCHQSLRSVAGSVTQERVVEVATLAWKSVAAINRRPPLLGLLGLNPHAGEEGLFGDEEERVLIPAKKTLEQRGMQVLGPLPPDTAFTPAMRKRVGCYLGMYHDQIAIPFKMLAFDTGVNVTMGLPIVRTSPDHGTAFDIAWRGKVRPDSFLAAYDLAARLAWHAEAPTIPGGLRHPSRKPFKDGD